MKKFSAVSTPLKGTNLIEASAGTGKTFTISMIYLRLIVEKGLRIDQVLVVTFTLPATMELRLRIRRVIAEALCFCETGSCGESIIAEIMELHKDDPVVAQRLRSALKSFDEASVYTIHSFCQQVLSDNAFESGALFSSDIVTDGSVEEMLAADFWRENVYSLPEEVAGYIIEKTSPGKLLSLYKQRPLSPNLKIRPEPEEMDARAISMLAEPVRKSYETFCEAWADVSDSIFDIISRSESLPGGITREDYLASRINAVNEYAGGGDCFNVPGQLFYFTFGILKKTTESVDEQLLPLFDEAQKLYDSVNEYNSSFSGFLNSLKHRFFCYMDEKGKEKKGKTGLRDFDDLIKDMEYALRGKGGDILAGSVGGRYKAALIDEFQDTDDLQFEIFNRIFMREGSILFLIGDPKQAIYRFRGADIFSYIKASNMVKNRYTLANNFRSTPELIKSVNELFAGHSVPFVFEEIGFTPVESGKKDQCEHIYRSGLKFCAMNIGLADYGIAKSGDDDNDSIILRQISSEIAELTGSGEYEFIPSGKSIRPPDIAVLVRSHGQAADVQRALAFYGIPSVVRGHNSVLETDEAGELCRVISAIAEPGRSRLVKSAAATLLFGYDALTLYKMNEEQGEGAALLGGITERFYGYRETWVKGGFMDMFTLLLHDEGITVRILEREGGERILANINHLSEILNMAQFENSFSPDELAVWFESSILSPPYGDEYTIRLDKDSDAVQIVTMHACKGLEYPIVFCPYLTHSWQPPGDAMIYHEPAEGNVPVLSLDKDRLSGKEKKLKESEDLAENLRLMYVAVTRAKSMCRILFMMKRQFKSSAPFYLLLKEGINGNPRVEDCYAPFIEKLKGLAENSGGDIDFSVIRGDRGRQYMNAAEKPELFEQKIFTGEVNTTWGMQSYSSITRTLADEKGDGSYGRVVEEGSGIFAFPRGARAGLCLHEIFEITDFRGGDTGTVSDTVQSVLRKYGYEDSWGGDVTGMFFNVTGAVLPGSGGASLSDIGMDSRLSEMEFNFPLGGFSVAALREVFSTAPGYGRAVYERLGSDDSEISGMMKGFIDLVFRIGNRYYIADWKSNILGITTEDYNLRIMEEEMLHHNYHLQYYLYTVALHRYLSLRLGDSYRYSEHFGGVYYFFIRGITAGEGSSGIFYTVPDEATVLRLDDFFRGEELT
ncbi:MAG TPA: exodeoxyribonuclease V subunit beta [Spirochaetota bacterium]|nr:exodeoxyribonuclease V subunit beta [Spirochaetota bacterium]